MIGASVRNHLVAFYLFVSVGRVHELLPQLQSLPFGKISLLMALLGVLFSEKEKAYETPRTRIVNVLWMLLFLALMSVFISVWKSQSIQEIKGTVLTLLSSSISFIFLVEPYKMSRTLLMY